MALKHRNRSKCSGAYTLPQNIRHGKLYLGLVLHGKWFEAVWNIWYSPHTSSQAKPLCSRFCSVHAAKTHVAWPFSGQMGNPVASWARLPVDSLKPPRAEEAAFLPPYGLTVRHSAPLMELVKRGCGTPYTSPHAASYLILQASNSLDYSTSLQNLNCTHTTKNIFNTCLLKDL